MGKWIKRIISAIALVAAIIGLGNIRGDIAGWEAWLRQLGSAFGLQGLLILTGVTIFFLSICQDGFGG